MTLRFEPAGHKYFLDEEQIPSVTQVLEREQVLDGIPRDTLEAAREFGQHVHSAIALALQKQLDWKKLDPKLVPYVSAAMLFVKEAEVQVLRVEQRMHDPALKYAGALDLLGVLRKHTAVIDWKTAASMPRTAGLQLAAYEQLFRRNYGGRPLKRYGVQLFGKGNYKLVEYDDARDFNWFLSCLNLWHWRNT
jgi:hypothetical protein